MAKRNILVLIIFVFTLCSCSKPPSVDYVKVSGNKFMIGDKPYYFLGANFWHGAYLGANLVEGDKERLIRELDQLKNYNITNLRVMAATENSVFDASVKPAFQHKPGVYNETLFVGLDFMLAEMEKRNMKAVLVLNNYWQWSGGMSQYINWITGDSLIDPDKTGRWDDFQTQSARFYTNKACNEAFRNYIKMLVTRKNTITGVEYSNDPTIMSWQLANEPRPAPDANENEAQQLAFVDWVAQTADFIHSIDKNHLVSTGNEGLAGTRSNKELFEQAHRHKGIDYLTFHIWPKNWGWFDATKAEQTFGVTIENTINYFAEHIRIADEMQKPIVLEEFGLERDSASFSPQAKTFFRDKYLEFVFNIVTENAKSGAALAGLNFWAWGGEGIARHDDYMWRKGDSFMGDPPQEPQGLNSIFSTDTSTLGIFSKYNKILFEMK